MLEQGGIMSKFYVLDFLSSFSSLFTAIFVAFGVLLVVRGMQRLERQQKATQTAELIAKYFWQMQFPRDAVRALPADDFVAISGLPANERPQAFEQITTFLNDVEFLAMLVNSGTIDEKMVATMMRSQIVGAFAGLIEYIIKTREKTGNPSLFKELEVLAHRWGGSRDF
jgi:Domain of unknown function (DUF4760)